MTHYFSGIDRKGRISTAIHLAARDLTDVPFVSELIQGMDTAEQRLIGCFVPPGRRNGAIATWMMPARDHRTEKRIPGQFVAVTIRRFPDAPEDTIAGENWKLIDARAITKTPSHDDADLERVVIGLPIADLLALRAGGLDCDGIFVPYQEAIRQDDQGRQYYANELDLNLLSLMDGVNDFLDSWEPESPKAIEECQRVAWERTLWIDWSAGSAAAPIQHPPIGGTWGYNAPI